jgi:hypothetical protein
MHTPHLRVPESARPLLFLLQSQELELSIEEPLKVVRSEEAPVGAVGQVPGTLLQTIGPERGISLPILVFPIVLP